jgi:L-amino acid N-acyltransferase YncA
MNFRTATVIDLKTIVDIYNSTIAGRMVTADTEPVTESDKQDWFFEHNNKRPLWMVEDENFNCIGWVSFQDFYGRKAYEGTAEISIYLHEDFRGKGFGKKILQSIITAAPTLGLHTLLGYIFAHNTPSLQLFLQQGFEEWAHLKDIAVMDNKNYSLKILGRRV